MQVCWSSHRSDAMSEHEFAIFGELQIKIVDVDSYLGPVANQILCLIRKTALSFEVIIDSFTDILRYSHHCHNDLTHDEQTRRKDFL